jgi:RHS repeat-associated protein
MPAAGPDGDLYFTDSSQRIRRIRRDGVVEAFAGMGALSGFAAEGAHRLDISLNGGVRRVRVGPDGSVYVAQNHQILRIAPDGIVRTVVGAPEYVQCQELALYDDFGGEGCSPEAPGCICPPEIAGDGAHAIGAMISVYDFDLLPDGSIVWIQSEKPRVMRANNDGRISTYAGFTEPTEMYTDGDGNPVIADVPVAESFYGESDGELARAAKLPFSMVTISAGSDGSVYLTDYYTVRHIAPDGRVRMVLDRSGIIPLTDGALLDDLLAFEVMDAAAGPNGELVLLVEEAGFVGPDLLPVTTSVLRVTNGRISRVVKDIPRPNDGYDPTIGVGRDGGIYLTSLQRITRLKDGQLIGYGRSIVPAPDGRHVFFFDPEGRHTDTLDTGSGATTTFRYDIAGRFDAIIDPSGAITTIQRNGLGTPTSITSSGGQITTVAMTNGKLTTITAPDGLTTSFTYSGGLLTGRTDPGGAAHAFSYDGAGRLIEDSGPTGAFTTLTRTLGLPDGQKEVVVTTSDGTSRIHEQKLNGGLLRTVTLRDGSEQVVHTDLAGGSVTMAPDGTTTEVTLAPDPIGGMTAPYPARVVITSPGGRVREVNLQVTATFDPPNDAMSPETITTVIDDDGAVSTIEYEVATRTETTTSAEGRVSVRRYDPNGSVQSESEGPGLAEVTYATGSGLLLVSSSANDGTQTRMTELAYDPQRRLSSAIDPSGRTTNYSYDGVSSRMSTITNPDGTEVAFSYDSAGRLGSVTPPGRPAHFFVMDGAGRPISYTPPVVGAPEAVVLTRRPTGAVESVNFADGSGIDISFDGAGRPIQRDFARGAVVMDYDSAGRLASIAGADGVDVAFDYDGAAATQFTWSGDTTGVVQLDLDDRGRAVTQRVNGSAINTVWDDDNMVVAAGPMVLTRSAATGLVTTATAGAITVTSTYDTLGRERTRIARRGATTLFSEATVLDDADRVESTTVTDSLGTRSRFYERDAALRLVTVRNGGSAGPVLAAYDYDENGNRDSRSEGATTLATYDAQDRLVSSGTASFTHNARGQLVTKTDGADVTSYDYDEEGALLGVSLPDGTQVTYAVDGLGRRVARYVDGAMTHGWLYAYGHRPVAELDGSGNVVARFVYGRSAQTPDVVVKNGVPHVVVADHLGSVRLVARLSDGVVVAERDYGAWGEVVRDTNPGFLPFGYGGGHEDTATGLVRFGVRDYDPLEGRFTTRDPILFMSGQTSLYAFAESDPLSITDPSGLSGACKALRDFIDKVGNGGWPVWEMAKNGYLPAGRGDSAALNNGMGGAPAFESIYGPVDVDWMINFAYAGASASGVGLGLTVAANAALWPAMQMAAFGSSFDSSFGSSMLWGNPAERNAWEAAAAWTDPFGPKLQEIFKPALDACECE